MADWHSLNSTYLTLCDDVTDAAGALTVYLGSRPYWWTCAAQGIVHTTCDVLHFRRREIKMYSCHGRLCVSVCLSVCPSPHSHTTARTWM